MNSAPCVIYRLMAISTGASPQSLTDESLAQISAVVYPVRLAVLHGHELQDVDRTIDEKIQFIGLGAKAIARLISELITNL